MWGAFSGLACLIRELFYVGIDRNSVKFDSVASIDPILWPQGSYSHAEPTVCGLGMRIGILVDENR